MTCIMTVLTVLSVFNGSVWNDVEVKTQSKIIPETHPYVLSKVEQLSDTKLLGKTITVQCGDKIEAKTNSFLKTTK